MDKKQVRYTWGYVAMIILCLTIIGLIYFVFKTNVENSIIAEEVIKEHLEADDIIVEDLKKVKGRHVWTSIVYYNDKVFKAKLNAEGNMFRSKITDLSLVSEIKVHSSDDSLILEE